MKRNVLFWLAGQNRRRIPALALLAASQVGSALFGVLFALGSRAVIDSAVYADTGSFLRACIHQGSIILGILSCMIMSRHLRDRLRADLERDWKQRLLHGLLHGDFSAVSAYHSGELLNRLNNDVRKVNDGVISIVPSAAGLATRLLVALAVLGILDLKFTLLIAVLGMIAIASTTLMRRKLKGLNKRVSEYDGKVSGFLQELMEKLLMIQAMDVSAEVERRSDQLLAERYAIQRKRKNISLLANTAVSIMYYGAGFLALIWSGWRLLRGEITFGSLTAVIQLVNQLQTPFVDLSGLLPKYLDMVSSGERLLELESVQGTPVSSLEAPEAVYAAMDDLCAEELSFSYDREIVLKDASFRVPKGAFAVITGPSGIGKSTLLKLMLGIFRPEEGSLFADCGGNRVTLDRSTRRLFAYVPQGNLLLSGTIRDNLTVTAPDATQDQINNAVFVSCMDCFLPDLPRGLDTVLGENGAGLSEGQIQRLAIARAVLSGAPILLLDECTSALDEETERKVLQRLKTIGNRTCIAVTHRPAAMALCDYRIEFSGGQIQMVKNQ